jgi:hypothetical protein
VNELDAPSVPDNWRYHQVLHSNIEGLTDPSKDALYARELASASSASTPAAGSSTSVSSGASSSGSPSSNPTPNYDRLTGFLDASQNPIIRSFESARGRGLAGFITDLKFDWTDVPWEIKQGSRAPLFMKLTVTFSPIHDIPMGLDSDGMMRSVAYNVGNLSKMINGDPYRGHSSDMSAMTDTAAAANANATAAPEAVDGGSTPSTPIP